MAAFLRCLFGPQLLRLNLRQGMVTDYEAVAAERWGDTVITSVTVAARILLYASPIVFPMALKQGWFTMTGDGAMFFTKLITGLGIVVAGALLLRTLGRLSNPAYTQFSSVLADAARDYTAASKVLLSRYDFHFSAWPVDWDVKQQAGYV